LMDLGHSLRVPAAPAAQTRGIDISAANRPAPVRALSVAGDEAFLSDVDASLAHASVPELRALDDLTPHAGDRSR
jgi:hypothetical protein